MRSSLSVMLRHPESPNTVIRENKKNPLSFTITRKEGLRKTTRQEESKEGGRDRKIGRLCFPWILSSSQRPQRISCHVKRGESFLKVIGITITTMTARKKKKVGVACSNELFLVPLEVSHSKTVTENYITVFCNLANLVQSPSSLGERIKYQWG